MRLEGHTDERGSREYNIGLGERRAQAVRRALMLQGVGDAQIVTVSYGEERPAQPGSDEAAWAKNRRVELVYGELSNETAVLRIGIADRRDRHRSRAVRTHAGRGSDDHQDE